MTTREIFNKVRDHLLTQGVRSMSRRQYKCAYRGDNGLKCAAGCLILDEHYSAEIENCVINQHGALKALKSSVPGITDAQIRMVRMLQTIHDFYHPSDWPRKLGELKIDEAI